MDKRISVLMSVYKNDVPKNVVVAVESVVNQTLPPEEVVLVVDGPVGKDMEEALKGLEEKHDKIKIVRSEKNVGLGNALQIGQSHCRMPFIARMDSDDISVPERFEKQMACFEKDPKLDVVGSFDHEFFENLDNLANMKTVPEKHEEIVAFMRGRCPFCHNTVIMKTDSLKKAGGYKSWYYAEDWFLWIRMYLAGAKFYNIQEPLVYARINYDTFSRRGGLKYYKSIKGILKFMKQEKMIGFSKYTKEKCKRFVGHVLMPKKLKHVLYMKFMRKKK